MALQPAAGARDLNPQQVDSNRTLVSQLARVYRLWGYEEVAPPTFERLETLQAGGGIDGRELVRLATEEALGLRPEMTASIARAAGTRMAGRSRPLRLWYSGPIYRSRQADGGGSGQQIVEELQSGVELLGGASAADDSELLRLLLACLRSLGLDHRHHTQLLLGHHGVLAALLEQVPAEQRTAARQALTSFDSLAIAALPLPDAQRQGLQRLMRLRGEPAAVLYQLEQLLGPCALLENLATTLATLAPTAAAQGVSLSLDPSFQPHFALYDGLVLKVVCRGTDTAPVEIASGGRYDALVGRFCGLAGQATAAGMGFSFAVEPIRDLLEATARGGSGSRPVQGPILVAYGQPSQLPQALDQLEALHGQGQAAELLSRPCATAAEAEHQANRRGCRSTLWIA
jgi:ATP phosphoribosyltransferase regulatory subunit